MSWESSAKIRSSSKSKASKILSCSNKSDNSKARAVEEEAKFAEALFLIKQQMAENEVENLNEPVDGRGWKNEQYGTEALSIIEKSKHGGKNMGY